MAAAIVGSRLDYCNSLLAGTSVSNLARLQLVQNTLARVVTQKSRFCRITPVLADLHWLPVRHRLNFKIATIAFKVLHFQQPSYLAALVPQYHSMCLHDHCDLLLPCQYVFLQEKLQWQGASLSHPLPQTFGISYHDIFHPSPLFLLSGRDSSINFFRVPSPDSIHWHHALWCHHIHECKSHHIHLAAQLTHSSWAPMISLDSHQNIRLHTGAHVNVVLLTYLNYLSMMNNDWWTEWHTFKDVAHAPLARQITPSSVTWNVIRI